MKILLSTEEGYSKDKTPGSRKRMDGRKLVFTFSGNDAPLKAARAIIQKYGITMKDILGEQ